MTSTLRTSISWKTNFIIAVMLRVAMPAKAIKLELPSWTRPFKGMEAAITTLRANRRTASCWAGWPAPARSTKERCSPRLLLTGISLFQGCSSYTETAEELGFRAEERMVTCLCQGLWRKTSWTTPALMIIGTEVAHWATPMVSTSDLKVSGGTSKQCRWTTW